jgi:SAM-dependent methyltransferase/uncharacterized protein YbaR (Trm112 family)
LRDPVLRILACPDCGGGLRLDGAVRDADRRIEHGGLTCTGCATTYPIRGGIPRLLPRSWLQRGAADAEVRTRNHFRQEFLALAVNDRDLMPHHLQEFYFFSRTGIDPAVYERFPGVLYPTTLPDGHDQYRPNATALRGKWVLDAGCGPGRLIPIAAEAAEHVIGLDLGEHVARARARSERLENVDFVQGSVLHPPFRPGTFDYVYSLGVLHHTPDPRAGVQRLARVLREGGDMSIWVYPKAYWGGPLKAPVGKLLHAMISRMGPEASLRCCARYLYRLGRVQMAVARRRWTKLLCAPLFLVNVPRHQQREVMITTIHDYYGPPIISTHTFEELESWMRDAGFADVRRLPVPIGCYGRNRSASAMAHA